MSRALRWPLLAFVLGACAIGIAIWRSPSLRVGDEVVHLAIPAGALQPQVVIDDGGTLHLVYFQGDPAGGDLYYARSTDMATLTEPIRVNSEPGTAIAIGTIRGAQIARGGDGRIHVVWNGARGEPTPMWYARSDPPRERFEDQRNLMTRTVGLDGGGAVAADRTGNVWVAWHGREPSEPEDEARRRVWVAHSSDAGARFSAEQPVEGEPTGTCACCGMGLHAAEVGEVGELLGLYRAAREGRHRDMALLRGARGETVSTSLRARTLDPWELQACPMSSVALASRGERSVGAWEMEARVRLARLDGSETPAIVDLPDESGPRKHPRIAIAADGRVLVAWIEGSAWSKGGDAVWQLLDADLAPIAPPVRAGALPAWSFAAVAAHPDGRFVLVR